MHNICMGLYGNLAARTFTHLYAYKLAICLIMFLQKDRLHSADATTIAVDSFRRDLWMFLYEAYFVWLPTMYFHCAGCAHLCPGLRSLGCGWLWYECSPRLLGRRKPFTCRSVITRFSSNMWARMISKRVSLLLCPTGESGLWFGGRCRRKATILRCIVVPISRWSSSCPRQCIARIFSRTLYWPEVSRLCSLHNCMHWSWSAKILHNLKKFRKDIDVFG